MSIKEKFSSFINGTDDGYVDDANETQEEFDFKPRQNVETPAQPRTGFRSRNDKAANVVNFAQVKPAPEPGVVLKAISSVEETESVINVLKQGRIVVLNLEKCVDQQRVIDVMYGAKCALDCRLENVAEYAYVITPKGVTFSGAAGDNSENTDM